MCMENVAQELHAERLIQHKVKLSAVLALRHLPSVVFFIHISIGGASKCYFLVILLGAFIWSA